MMSKFWENFVFHENFVIFHEKSVFFHEKSVFSNVCIKINKSKLNKKATVSDWCQPSKQVGRAGTSSEGRQQPDTVAIFGKKNDAIYFIFNNHITPIYNNEFASHGVPYKEIQVNVCI